MSGRMTGAVEVHFGDVTGRLVILLFFGALTIGVAWSVRELLVAKERQRLQRVASLPDAGVDEDLLLRRLRQRQTGRVIGIGVIYVLLGGLLAWSGDGLPWLALCIPFGAALGTGIGQLQPVGPPTRPRVAQVRVRELGDYVLPLERRLLWASRAFPVAAFAVLLVGRIDGSPSWPTVAVTLALLAAVTLAAGVIGRALEGVLESSVAMSSAAGLSWEEIVRAQTLRDLVGSGSLLAAAGSVGCLWWASAQPGWPSWVEGAAYVLALGALLVLGSLLVLALTDSHFTWARAHALDGMPS